MIAGWELDVGGASDAPRKVKGEMMEDFIARLRIHERISLGAMGLAQKGTASLPVQLEVLYEAGRRSSKGVSNPVLVANARVSTWSNSRIISR